MATLIHEHQLGSCCLISGSAWLTIPKNASSLLRELSKHDGLLYNETIFNYPLTVVIRDPVDRWVSGMSEYLSRKTGGYFVIANQPTYDDLYNKIEYDAHTAPQHRFFENFTVNQFYLFEDIPSLFPKSERINSMDSTWMRRQVKDWVLSKMDDRLEKQIIKYYEKDYQLYQELKKQRNA